MCYWGNEVMETTDGCSFNAGIAKPFCGQEIFGVAILPWNITVYPLVEPDNCVGCMPSKSIYNYPL
jgi:hypothetical protein